MILLIQAIDILIMFNANRGSELIVLVMFFYHFIIKNRSIRNILYKQAPDSRFWGYFDFLYLLNPLWQEVKGYVTDLQNIIQILSSIAGKQ